MKNILSVFFLLVSIIFFSCSKKENICQDDSAISQPVQTDDGWQSSSWDSVQINSEKLQILVNKICDTTYQNIHSILIIKEGKLVFEQYFPGYRFNYEIEDYKGKFTNFNLHTIHNLASVTKSVTSILFGIAKDMGFITNLDEKLFKFFPRYSSLNDSMKDKITLEHLLTMTSGLEWNEQNVSLRKVENDIIQLFLTPDPVKYILSKPAIHPPGSNFYYNGGNTNLLGKIIQETSGQKLDVFAKKYLFDPLSIHQYRWVYLKPDLVYTSGNLKLRPRDMAKIGYLMLNKGIWKSKRVVSSQWIENSTRPHFHFSNKEGYGYQWWIKQYELGTSSVYSFAALGWGGQNIIVFPVLNTVVVLTGGNYATKSPNDEIIYRYILPSLDENFNYSYEKVKKEAPISEAFKIIKPSKTLNKNIASFSGHWYGRGDFTIADQLIVEKIDSSKASVLYSWGNHPEGYFKNGWVRRTANVDKSGKITFTLNEASLTFEFEKYEDVLIGYYKKEDVLSKLIMNRL